MGAAQSLDSKYYQEEDGWLKMANGHDDYDEDDNSDDEDDEDGDDHDKGRPQREKNVFFRALPE